MKKYVNGEYIEMTPEEVAAWEEAQKAVEDASGGVYQLIADITLEEDRLIEPITGVDYAAVKVDVIIPAMTSAPRFKISTNERGYTGYTGTVEKNNKIRIIREFDRKKNELPVDRKLSPYNSWLGKWSETYGINTVPERIKSIYMELGDTGNINFPAGTTVKIYARKE